MNQCAVEQNAMVAFVCGRPAMFLKDDGSWQKDDSTDCLSKPEEILDYCRKVYPDLDIRNVVEASKKARVPSWCGFNHEKCSATKHTYTVRPFRCWVGAFQSEALLVPEHCLFDHLYQPKSCKSFQKWNATARSICQDRGMEQQSFAILQPCGIDRFNGVEFVCCPSEVDAVKDEVDVFIQEELKADPPVAPTTSSPSSTTSTTEAPLIIEEEEPVEIVPAAKSVYQDYLANVNNQFDNEHEYFVKAKAGLQKHHHDKVTKMMKEWSDARQRVLELKEIDPKAADQLNQDITSRFQTTYEALEQEGNSEKQQISGVHQQRIEADLNNKKRNAMKHYMDELSRDYIEAPRLLKTLKHYIKMEQKDRLHSINHYKHLLDTDPRMAETMRDQILDHLKTIDQHMREALDMLNRVPQYEKKIRMQMDDFMKMYHSIDVSITGLLSQEISDLSVEDALMPDLSEPSSIGMDTKAYTMEKALTSTPEDRPVEPSPPELHHVELEKTEPILQIDRFDDEVMEDERDYVEVKPLSADHFNGDKLNVETSYIQKTSLKELNSLHTGTPLGIAVGSITVFIVIVVGIVVIRKRSQRTNNAGGFVEVDQVTSPEERHVTKMQMNGYENPTYKYFETGTSNA
ncbi:hypothetical protein CAPTEDRAFT_220772 [Capitella teleta]|uniref:Amyloid-beta A4 protein n=1 Tax=Capitella teleta TaxID=283909 RepID=R7TD28_CAPTE|nr:hypothetical protein CAPTEDRAFT_220772 [Capitella teleta]|eukprot:ELT91387.1 hypothetical protein CAPTEDRAFT_220772 [Capitella teleta]